MIHDTKPVASGGGRRGRLGLSLLIAALALCVLPGVADAKKKTDKIGVATFNLYLGSDLGPATQAILGSRTDLFADRVGEVFREIGANDFNTRAKNISKQIQKKKVDLLGLQEVALWKVQIPTDASGFNPAAQRATTPVIDYLDTLLEELNEKAKTKKECKEERQDANQTPGEKDDNKAARCYMGYKAVSVQQEADLEFLGDFDNNPGPDGQTCDLTSGLCPPPPNNSWALGNDDTGVTLGEPRPVRQCADGIDNDGDTNIDWPADAQCSGNLDGVEAVAGFQNTAAFPQDANFDSHGAAAVPNNPSPDGPGVGTDPVGVTDCPDNKTTGNSGGPFAGTAWAAGTQPVCLFHGIDGDLSLTMRDVILARVGNGVKTTNPRSNNFSNTFAVTIPATGGQIKFNRGWTAVDAKVRGKKFTLVNTHLESENNGSVREDQATELVAPGGPASGPNTVLVGDLNSDPNRAPVNLPNGDSGSSIAINRVLAAGYRLLAEVPGTATASHGDVSDVINNQSDTIGEGWIDHILTNGEDIERKGKTKLLDKFKDGLWSSDHAGVYVGIKGKQKD